MRRAVKPNHGCAVPRWHVALDCETTEQGSTDHGKETVNVLWYAMAHVFAIEGGRVTRSRRAVLRSPRAFWDWLYASLPERQSCWLWSHRAGYKLTAVQLWREISERRLRPFYRRRDGPGGGTEGEEDNPPRGLLVTDDPPTILDLEHMSGRRFVALDLMNFLPQSLSDIARSVGIPRGDEPGELSTDALWESWTKQAVEIVAAAAQKLCGWVKANDLGNLRYTASGQSLALWRHRCMDVPVTWGHDAYFKKLERAAYYPGKLRANYLGYVVDTATAAYIPTPANLPEGARLERGPVYRLDVNSCYPAVMGGNDYPTKHVGTLHGPTPGEVRACLAVHECCAWVTVHSLDTAYPLRTPDGVSWRVGTFRTALCGPDLRRALDRGHVKHVHEVQKYTRGRPFTSFVQAVLAMRDRYTSEGDKVFASLAKQLGNALHGKFGQWGGGYVTLRADLPPREWGTYFSPHPKTGQTVPWRSIGYHPQLLEAQVEQPNSFPLISAYVSAYARQLVADAVALCGEREVYYQDVDSIHVSALAYERLGRSGGLSQTEAGRWKVENVAKLATWRGPKNYMMDHKWTVSGISPHAYHDAQGVLRQVNFHRLDTLIADVPPPGPVTRAVCAPSPVPRIEGTVRPDYWLDYPVEGA